ncbi:MAG: tyrosinase family protein [Chloroflexota bacterium]
MITRRTFLKYQGIATTTFLLQGCVGEALLPPRSETNQTEINETQAANPSQVVRKSASNLSEEEQERFMLGWDLLIKAGKVGSIASEHAQFEHQVNHGIQVLADLTVEDKGPVGTHRFLPWHRAYIATLENEMRSELKAYYAENGIDPAEADKAFVPYWDASHDGNFPQWVADFKPHGEWSGVKVKNVQLELDNPCHEAYGLNFGEEYEVFFRRWPGTLMPMTPSVEQFQNILRTTTYLNFTNSIEWAPAIVRKPGTEEVELLTELLKTLPGEYPRILQPLIDNLETETIGTSPDKIATAMSQIRSILRTLQNAPGGADLISTLAGEELPTLPQETTDLLEQVLTVYQSAPHGMMHFYAGGQDPNLEEGCPPTHGTVVLFQEVAVDPIFFMLHAELDRVWYSWEKKNDGIPELTGDDALFRPWRGLDEESGRTWTLDELVDHDQLSFTYDVLYPMADE